MGKIICELATSVDGFIAEENGGFEWLNEFNNSEREHEMGNFFKQCGAAIMGSKTYELTLSFNSWFGEMKGIVFTSRKLPVFKNKHIQFCNGDPTTIVKELKQKEIDSWLVGGGILIADFINRNLLDEFVITIVPKLLGKGIALCPTLDKIQKLQLISSKQYKDGVMQMKYKF